MAGGNLSPRQKMINMMYLVLTALLALNVSVEVLLGYRLVNDSLVLTINNKRLQNEYLLKNIEDFAKDNPQKAGEIFIKAKSIKASSDSLLNYLDDLKYRIIQNAGGEEDGKIKNDADTDVIPAIMTSGVKPEGPYLKEMIDIFRQKSLSLTQNDSTKKLIQNWLETDPKKLKLRGVNTEATEWYQIMFDNLPVAAGVTLITKIQSDVTLVESEMYNYLLKQIDVGDFRVNSITAFMIPSSTNIIQGGTFSGKIVLAAVDSTKKPKYFVRGAELDPSKKGVFETGASQIGEVNLEGYVEMQRGDGSTDKFPFKQVYSVVPPMATVSATMMQILYAGFDNPVSISVPGVPSNKVNATVTNGSIKKNPDGTFIIRPQAVTKEYTISVSAEVEGKVRPIANAKFLVKPLPPPTPYFDAPFDEDKEKTISISVLKNTEILSAGLNFEGRVIPFTVKKFNILTNSKRLLGSDGNRFSKEQRDYMRMLDSGDMLIIADMETADPSGNTKKISGTIIKIK